MDIGRTVAAMTFLTRDEAAARARVSTKTIDRWLRDPRVPLTKHGTRARVLIDAEELDAYLRGSAKPTDQELALAA